MTDSSPVGVIDCGTNTTRMLITDGRADLSRLQTVTGMGRGVQGTGRLSTDGVERALAALGTYRDELTRHGVQEVRAIATSAARDAQNRADFFGPATDLLGVEVELLSGDDEARYGFAGATADLDPADGPFLVADIGGGSTELSFGRTEPEAYRSLDIGSVRFTEAYLHSDPPRPEELSSAISVARLHLDDIERERPVMGTAATLIGVAGTITTIAAVEIGLDPYDPTVIEGFELSRAAAEDVFRTLATESLADRVHNPGLQRERADVIVGGCCVLVSIMRYWDIDRCLVRERDLLDGIADELLSRPH
jgi:exopolyphosphatase / guanosine-5'-triphosphate,3'-diphosphate pyrophosphatase